LPLYSRGEHGDVHGRRFYFRESVVSLPRKLITGFHRTFQSGAGRFDTLGEYVIFGMGG
jgi:hypothetical protein